LKAGMGLIQYSGQAEYEPEGFFRRCGRFQIVVVVLVVVGIVATVVVETIVIEVVVVDCIIRGLFGTAVVLLM
jgi:hypothetical protein